MTCAVASLIMDRIKIVRLDSVEIIKGAVVGVVSFTVLEDGPRSVGEAVFIGDEYYRKLKPRGIYSPSRLRGKLFNLVICMVFSSVIEESFCMLTEIKIKITLICFVWPIACTCRKCERNLSFLSRFIVACNNCECKFIYERWY